MIKILTNNIIVKIALLLVFGLFQIKHSVSQDLAIQKDEKLDKPELNANRSWIDNSLMLNANEIKNLKIAISSLKNNVQYQSEDLTVKSEIKEVKEDSAQSLIHMSSILFLNNNNWVTWINEKRISNEDNKKDNEFYVENIAPNKAVIVWSLGLTKWKILTNSNDDVQTPELNKNNQIVNRFTISPNQTYILKTNKIIEGKISSQSTEVTEIPKIGKL